MLIKIKYHAPITPLERLAQGDWIDLRAAETVEMKQGDFRYISLGVSMELPRGYEAHLLSRSSTFKRYGIIQTSGMGIIDESFAGDNDIWRFQALALRDTVIPFNERFCQFRIVPKMPEVTLQTVEFLTAPNRGGYGSTGVE